MKMHDDFEWFIENYADIYKLCGKCFALISRKRIIGIYQDITDAIKEGNQKAGAGNFIVQMCDGTESAYTNYVVGAVI